MATFKKNKQQRPILKLTTTRQSETSSFSDRSRRNIRVYYKEKAAHGSVIRSLANKPDDLSSIPKTYR